MRYTKIYDPLYENISEKQDRFGWGLNRLFSTDRNMVLLRKHSPAETKIYPHFHDWLEFGYLVQGEQEVTIEERCFHLCSGDFIMIDYNKLHSSVTLTDCEKITFQIKNDALQEYFKIIPDFKLAGICCNSTLASSEEEKQKYETLIPIFLKMTGFFENQTTTSTMGFWGCFFDFFYTLMTSFTEGEPELPLKKKKSYSLDGILSYIHEHYDEPLSLESLAAHFGLTAPYVSKIIKDGTGMNYKNYLTIIRLNHAIYDLCNSTESVLTISEKCGFANVKSFINAFKKHHGTTPYQFRSKSQPLKNDNFPHRI